MLEYPIGNYNVEATYETHTSNTTVSMTENRQNVLVLKNFVIPEFSSFHILLPLMIATIVAAILYKRRTHIF